ncbi:MAG: hypothetical protein ACW986_03690 [Promethearchaeota archaeon]
MIECIECKKTQPYRKGTIFPCTHQRVYSDPNLYCRQIANQFNCGISNRNIPISENLKVPSRRMQINKYLLIYG